MGSDPVILVAEDDADDKFMLDTLFKQAGISCALHFVSNGEQLLDYLLRQGNFETRELALKPSVLILDLNMPKKDGRAALKEIRETPILSDLPVVILTTSEQPEDMEICKRLGISEYFVKPETLKGWLKIVNFVSNLC